MQLKVLGCSGGIGAQIRTTSFLIDEDILIDAGTGVEDLSLDELARIDHVFLTHSHLDHIAALPLMIDSVGSLRESPIRVYALAQTIQALRAHIFNWTIWPDFTQIPHPDRPRLKFEPIACDDAIEIAGRTIRALAARHTVPALGFHVSGPDGSLVFSGDTGPNEAFWRYVNGVPDLKHLIIETAFSNRERELAIRAAHLYPMQLADEIAQLAPHAHEGLALWITHLKPTDRQTIAAEVREWVTGCDPRVLERGQLLRF